MVPGEFNLILHSSGTMQDIVKKEKKKKDAGLVSVSFPVVCQGHSQDPSFEGRSHYLNIAHNSFNPKPVCKHTVRVDGCHSVPLLAH